MKLTDRIIIIDRQLEALEQVTRAESELEHMEALAEHLRTLGEHGRAIERVIGRLIESTGPGHPVRAVETGGGDVQVYLAHAGHLFEAAQTFASNARVRLETMCGQNANKDGTAPESR